MFICSSVSYKIFVAKGIDKMPLYIILMIDFQVLMCFYPWNKNLAYDVCHLTGLCHGSKRVCGCFFLAGAELLFLFLFLFLTTLLLDFSLFVHINSLSDYSYFEATFFCLSRYVWEIN